MADIYIHSDDVKLTTFCPENSNSLGLRFSDGTEISLFLRDNHDLAWALFDVLGDNSTGIGSGNWVGYIPADDPLAVAELSKERAAVTPVTPAPVAEAS